MSPQQPDPSMDRFYLSTDPEITPITREILTQYSGLPEDDIVKHIREVRDKAWKIFKYPCIGLYNFLNFSISKYEKYDEVLSRVKKGDQFLDLGCCFGQDIRRLIYDGAPPSNITGTELEASFIDLGYDLFLDKPSLAVNFVAGDFFTLTSLPEQSFDLIQANAFYHLFSWPEQVETVTKSLRLLKPKPGSVLFGRQTGVPEAGVVKHPQTRSGEMYRHNIESWTKLLEEVREKTGLKFDVEVRWDEKVNKKKVEDAWTTMVFVATLKGDGEGKKPLQSEHALKAWTT